MATNQNSTIQGGQKTRTPYFVGFSTTSAKSASNVTLTNVDLVKRDIENHFATPIGSRLMLPGFGSNIFSYLFDPFDEYTKRMIIDDAIRVVQTDPRVEIVEIDAIQEDQTLSIAMVLLFKPESITDSMYVSFSLTDKETF